MPEMPPPKPPRLPPEVTQRLKAMEADLASAKLDLEAIKKLGLDVTPLEEKLRWAELARSVLLERFGQ